MKGKTVSLLICFLVLIGAALAQPQPPHRVYGTISDDTGSVDSLSIDFMHSGSSVASTQTNSSGEYLLDIEYNNSYDNQDLELKIEELNTGKTVNYTSGEVEKLNYSGSNILKENFTVSGDVELNGSDADNEPVSFYYDGSEIKSGTTNGTGYYELEINFSTNYNEESIELYVDGNSTGKTTTFKAGGSDTLDYSEDVDSDDDDSDDDDNDDSGSNGDDSDNSDDTSDNSSDDSGDDSDDSGGSDGENGNATESSDGSDDYKVTSLEMSPDNPSPGEEVTITVNVENEGGSADSFEVELNAGDELLTKETDTLSPGESTTLDFNKTFESSEQYDIKAGKLQTTLTVGEAESGLPIMGMVGILGLLMILGVVAYIYLSGNSEGKEGEEKGAFDSFKRSKEDDEDSFDWKFADEE